METKFVDLICPISHCILLEPVIAEDGITYERTEICKWFEKNNTSPLTRQIIGKKLLTNQLAKNLICNKLEKYPEYKANQYLIQQNAQELIAKKLFEKLLEINTFTMDDLLKMLNEVFSLQYSAYVLHIIKHIDFKTVKPMTNIQYVTFFMYEDVVDYMIDNDLIKYFEVSRLFWYGSQDKIIKYINKNKLGLQNLDNNSIINSIRKNDGIIKYLIENHNYCLNIDYKLIINDLIKDVTLAKYIYDKLELVYSEHNIIAFYHDIIKLAITNKNTSMIEIFLPKINYNMIIALQKTYNNKLLTYIVQICKNNIILLNHCNYHYKNDTKIYNEIINIMDINFVNTFIDINNIKINILDFITILDKNDNLENALINKFANKIISYMLNAQCKKILSHKNIICIYLALKKNNKNIYKIIDFKIDYQNILENNFVLSIKEFKFVLQKLMENPIFIEKIKIFINTYLFKNDCLCLDSDIYLDILLSNITLNNIKYIVANKELCDMIINSKKCNIYINILSKEKFINYCIKSGQYSIIKKIIKKNIITKDNCNYIIENEYIGYDKIVKILIKLDTSIDNNVVKNMLINGKYCLILEMVKGALLEKFNFNPYFIHIAISNDYHAYNLAKYLIQYDFVKITTYDLKKIYIEPHTHKIIGKIIQCRPQLWRDHLIEINYLKDIIKEHNNKEKIQKRKW